MPLPPGSGTGAYEHAFREVVVPALDAFGPELIVIASGLDASAMDPLGRMMMTPRGYGELTRMMLDAADRLCSGRLVVEHEGGYSEELVPFCALAIVEALSGIDTDCRDTILQLYPEGMGYQELQPHQAEVIPAPPRSWSASRRAAHCAPSPTRQDRPDRDELAANRGLGGLVRHAAERERRDSNPRPPA